MDIRVAKALAIDRAIRSVKKADWRGNRLKEREDPSTRSGRNSTTTLLLAEIFEIVKAQSDY